ncbi:MAG TPA: AMP-binding protein [Bryobacteraceae bacterium]|nr:AMP-binding protein [Bryobacteraceae bacterium]
MELTGQQLLDQSIAMAERYSSAPPRSVVLVLLPHSSELFLLHIGLVLTGRLPAILAWPTSRVDPRKYQANLLHQLQSLPAAELITLPSLARNLDPSLPYPVKPLEHVSSSHLDRIFELPGQAEQVSKRDVAQTGAGAPEEALFLQFSGGTTGAQKCVVVTAPMLETQIGRLARTLNFGNSDSVVSWLPMYHDMGLIACLWLPLLTGAPSLQLAAQDWLMDPGLLFRLIERYRGTFCWLPNFAFSYLAAQRARMQPSSLHHVSAWINCSEPVRRKSVDAFTAAFSGWGVDSTQCQASYAMAENVFAVTQTACGADPLMVPRSALRGVSAGRQELSFDFLDDVYVSSGSPLDGMQVRIRSVDGRICDHLEPGGIEISTPCLFSGYWGVDGFRTHAFTADGWYATGDYGFTSGEELFVIGRIKDIVIVGGQNVFPEDVEAVANSVDGVYAGRVVAFGLEDSQQGTENLAIVAEMRGEFDPASAKKIEREISRTVLSAIGIAPRFVRVVPERWIVKSTAGKISRRETRLRFLEESEPSLVGSGRVSR